VAGALCKVKGLNKTEGDYGDRLEVGFKSVFLLAGYPYNGIWRVPFRIR